MEISVRKADLVKELQLVQGIVERKNSIPILSNVLAEAKGGELRHRPPPTSTSPCAAAARRRSRPRAPSRSEPRSSTRSRARCRTSDVRIKVLPDAWAQVECERSASRWPACRRKTSRPCPSPRRKGGVDAARRRAARPHRPDRLRHHRGGRALLPGGRAHGPRQGRRRRWSRPTGIGSPTPTAQVAAQGDRAPARAGAAQGDPGDRAPAGGRGGRRTFQQVGQPPGVHGRRAHARLQDHRGPVPGVREGDRRCRRQADRPRTRAAGHRHPPREPPLVGAQPRRSS